MVPDRTHEGAAKKYGRWIVAFASCFRKSNGVSMDLGMPQTIIPLPAPLPFGMSYSPVFRCAPGLGLVVSIPLPSLLVVLNPAPERSENALVMRIDASWQRRDLGSHPTEISIRPFWLDRQGSHYEPRLRSGGNSLETLSLGDPSWTRCRRRTAV
jgi:hypothetical protein